MKKNLEYTLLAHELFAFCVCDIQLRVRRTIFSVVHSIVMVSNETIRTKFTYKLFVYKMLNFHMRREFVKIRLAVSNTERQLTG